MTTEPMLRARLTELELDSELVDYFEARADERLSEDEIVSALRVMYDAKRTAALAPSVLAIVSPPAADVSDDEAAVAPLDAPVVIMAPAPTEPASGTVSKYAFEGSWGKSLDALAELERSNVRGACPINTITTDELIAATRAEDPKARQAALKELCPCHTKKDVEAFWHRIAEMAMCDPDAGVRFQAMHNLCDGSPPWMEDRVLECLRELEHDASPDIRKKARMVLTKYRYEGRWNVM